MAPDGRDIPRGTSEPCSRALQPHRSHGVTSVRCDLSFLTCLYFLSSCVVFMFFILISCSPYVQEAGSL